MSIPMSEEEFTDWTIDLFRTFGWLVHHDRPARTSQGWRTAVQGHPGFPDIVAIRRGSILFAELKVGKGKPTEAQAEWLTAAADLTPGWLQWVGGTFSYRYFKENKRTLIVGLFSPAQRADLEDIARHG